MKNLVIQGKQIDPSCFETLEIILMDGDPHIFRKDDLESLEIDGENVFLRLSSDKTLFIYGFPYIVTLRNNTD